MVAGTAVEAAEAFTEAAVADFMGAAAGFTVEEDSPADTQGLVAAAVRLAAGLVAASTEAGALTVAEVGAVEVGAAEAGAEDTVTAGAGGGWGFGSGGPLLGNGWGFPKGSTNAPGGYAPPTYSIPPFGNSRANFQKTKET